MRRMYFTLAGLSYLGLSQRHALIKHGHEVTVSLED